MLFKTGKSINKINVLGRGTKTVGKVKLKLLGRISNVNFNVILL